MKARHKSVFSQTKIARSLLVAIAAASPVLAMGEEANYDNRWYLTPGVSYIIADDDRQADNNFGFQFGAGKPVHKHWNIELNGLYDNLDLEKVDAEYKQRGLLLDGLFFFNREQKLPIYAVVGAGAMRTKLLSESSTNLIANAGLGFTYEFSDLDIKLRGDARYRLDNDDNSVPEEDRFGDWVFNLGLMIPLGKKAEPLAAAALLPVAMQQTAAEESKPVEMAVVDLDGDGIADTMDACMDSKPGVSVDAKGCEIDSDGDLVADSQDQCANTPSGVTVDAKGCEVDSDGDLVADSLDQCANTPAGVEVDAKGCEVVKESIAAFETSAVSESADLVAKIDCHHLTQEKIFSSLDCSLQDVIDTQSYQFELGSADLNEQTQQKLKLLADRLMLHPSDKIIIQGHTDNQGSYSFNQQLSKLRAEKVRTYLIDRGVDANMLQTRGLSSDVPVADNNTDEGRAKNRRVDMLVSD